jgi:hypothetical protein
VKNILATDKLRLPFRLSPTALVLSISMTASTAWGVWATDKLLELERREVVTVQLARIMGDFVEAEARSGRPPEETRERVQAYLKAVDASVRKLGREGRTVMVAEAVVAGSAPDLTEAVRAEVGRRMGATANVQQ